MRYTFTLTRGGAVAVASGAVAGTALVFAAGLLVGAAASVPQADALVHVDSARIAAHQARTDSLAAAIAADTAGLNPYAGCPEADPRNAAWTGEWGGGAYRSALRAVDLPPAPHTGGPGPEDAEADSWTLGIFREEAPALALLRRMRERKVAVYMETRMGPDGAPEFRVQTGWPEDAQ